MSKLRIQIAKDAWRQVDFISWKDDRRGFYVRDENSKAAVVTLAPPQPRGAVWTHEPFPEGAPTVIRLARLVPPPCRETQTEAKALTEFVESGRTADVPTPTRFRVLSLRLL